MLAEKLLGTVGNASNPNWIDDVFSTYLYTGTGSAQTITNNIDLATDGGLVWIKSRSSAVEDNYVQDTVRGTSSVLITNGTYAALPFTTNVTSFNNNGFSVGTGSGTNSSGYTYASWTFAKQAKFFDVVTYTGTGSVLTLNHSLGSTPGFIIVKGVTTSYNWFCYHRSTGETKALSLNSTNPATTNGSAWNNTAPTSTQFTIGTNGEINQSGQTYVAYLFAHDAGGFGTSGTDNVISCGSFTTNGSGNATVNLGYEPQWVMVKTSASSDSWRMYDVMRGMPVGSSGKNLNANTEAAESAGYQVSPTATGFTFGQEANATYIYIAIRRPMKPPTTGTEVFSPIISNSAQDTKLTTNFVVDAQLLGYRTGSVSSNWTMYDRLRGVSSNTSGGTFPRLITSGTAAEDTSGGVNGWDNTGFRTSGAYASINAWYANFRRAPGFFDEVCYTGTGSSGNTQSHNLGVPPELVIIKSRTSATNWNTSFGFTATTEMGIELNSAGSAFGPNTYGSYIFASAPTATTLPLTNFNAWNQSGNTYVAYLFATVAGVSKVGTYTGTGTVTQTINAGFGASGARWVMIKRIDASGGWYVFDTARGFTSSSSPYLLLNSTAAEVTGNNGCYAASTGFTLTTNASATVNINGASYIYLAIA